VAVMLAGSLQTLATAAANSRDVVTMLVVGCRSKCLIILVRSRQ